MQDELRKIWRATGQTILFITHGIDEAVYLGNRVAVLSARPGRITEIVDIDLRREGIEDLRSSAQFREYRHHLWLALRAQRDATQRDATQRDATQRDATQRDAAQRNASGLVGASNV
mgnify:FL=1